MDTYRHSTLVAAAKPKPPSRFHLWLHRYFPRIPLMFEWRYRTVVSSTIDFTQLFACCRSCSYRKALEAPQVRDDGTYVGRDGKFYRDILVEEWKKTIAFLGNDLSKVTENVVAQAIADGYEDPELTATRKWQALKEDVLKYRPFKMPPPSTYSE